MIDALLYIILMFCFLGAMAIIILVYMFAGDEYERCTIQVLRRSRPLDSTDRPYPYGTHDLYRAEEDAKGENIY